MQAFPRPQLTGGKAAAVALSRWPTDEESGILRRRVLAYLLCSLSIGGCGGPLVMERVDFEDGMVVGDEQVAVDAGGRVDAVREDGYIADDRYLKAYEYGDDLGPNAPGYIR